MASLLPPHLDLEEVLVDTEHESVSVASELGHLYLVLGLRGPSGPWWVYGETSRAAIVKLKDKDVQPWIVLHHSSTGTVEVVRTKQDGSLDRSVLLCSELPSGHQELLAA